MDSDIFSILPTLKFHTPPVVLEIGAANGMHTNQIFDCLNPSEYFAFEPDPRNIESFKCLGISLRKEVHLFQCAVGDQNSLHPFYASTGWNPHFECEHTLSGSLKKPLKHITAFPHCEFKDIIYVREICLDDLLDFYVIPEVIGFIWCDVQGAEDLVIRGGQKALSRTKYFFTEYYDEEMYEGQIGAAEIHNRLPGDWELVKKWEADILFRNTAIE